MARGDVYEILWNLFGQRELSIQKATTGQEERRSAGTASQRFFLLTPFFGRAPSV
jgi:hypothetical protein